MGSSDVRERIAGAGMAPEAGVSSRKPGLPPLLPCALALWASCALAYELLQGASSSWALALAFAGAAASVCLGAALVKTRGAVACIMLLGLSLGLSCAGGAALGMRAFDPDAVDTRSTVIVLLEDAKLGSFGSSAACTVHPAEGRPFKASAQFAQHVDLLCGAQVEADVRIKAPTERNAPFLWRSGAVASVSVDAFRIVDAQGAQSAAFAIRSLRAAALDTFGRFGGEQAGILQALVCGYRNTIDDAGAYDDYQAVGLAHIVAVSGSHLAIIAATFEWLLSRLRAPRALRLLSVSAFVLAYLVFSGMPISAVRAAFMVVLAVAAQGAGRRNAALNALALCIMGFMAFDPATALSVSFALSAGSTLGIIAFALLLSSWASGTPRWFRAALAEPAALTLASSLATQPFSAALFSQLSLVSPLANLLAAPLFSIGCVVGLASAAASVAAPALAAPATALAAICVAPLEALVDALARVPFACIPLSLPVVPMIVASVVLCVGLWVAWPRLGLRSFLASFVAAPLALAVALVASSQFHGDEIIMLDVGQGDAFIVRSEGKSLLIDTGNQDALVKRALGANGIFEIDAVAITHADDDHCGSLDAVDQVTRIGAIMLSSPTLSCACDNCMRLAADAHERVGDGGVKSLGVGDAFSVGKFTVRVVAPHEFTDEGGNGDSLCLEVSIDADGDGSRDWSALFCGDAEREQIAALLEKGLIGRIDVLKVGHHGARVALSEEVLRVLSPSIALVSCGEGNRYGHPHNETVSLLEGSGATTLRTDVHGCVTLSFSAREISVCTEVE